MKKYTLILFSVGLACIMLSTLIDNSEVIAQDDLHPVFPLLDANGENVLQSGNAISTMQTCGTCHDTTFIASHSVHADAGQSLVGNKDTLRSWQTGISWYGGWNPITYINPSQLPIAEWVQTLGWRHVGGGPAEAVDVEMNCFLCHLESPNNEARITALKNGDFQQATNATLAGTGIVDDNWQINPAAFNTEGELLPEYITLADPRDANCGYCHGVVDENAQIPLVFDPFDTNQWNTLTTGQVFSPGRISNSGMNLAGKNDLSRTWDVHAERVVNCTDCHYALNNPIFYVEPEANRPDHLEFDPRRMEFGDYLQRPLHQFANGGSEFADTFPVFNRAIRDCNDCHNAESTHTWLEYPKRHMQALACETCHIPQLNAPALQSVDWTVLDNTGQPQMKYRGVDTSSEPALITGYTPVLLADDEGKLAPYNLISAWYWIYGDAEPVAIADLQAVYFESDAYAADILAMFDTDKDGLLSADEQIINTDEKEALIAGKLSKRGLENPRIMGEVEPYAINHNVTHGEWATRDCSTCHNEDSRLNQPMTLSGYTPGGVQPALLSSNLGGNIETGENGQLMFTPALQGAAVDLYVLGHHSVSLVDWAGVLIFLATLVVVMLHAGLRYLSARQAQKPAEPELQEVYMYGIYERQWHWLQTTVIFGLIFTGLVIHKPEIFGMFNFRGVVLFHNTFALILVVNAVLAAFYHIASGEIKQFLPEPRGFFGQMFAQARYYAYGIFKGEAHPFEKTRNHKLNPIQQLTYFGLLNVLLPLQVITGGLMWGAQHYPELANLLGGLPLLAPIHTMISWLMATFIVVHVYMTTTGHTPTANIQAMIFGWDEVEVHPSAGGD